jgi:hypothetical protein
MGYQDEIRYGDLAARLNAVGQGHVFRFWPYLTPQQQADFARQLESLDWELIDRLVREIVKRPQKFELKGDVQPTPYYPYRPADPALRKKLEEALARGGELVREGKVAAFVVAGGAGDAAGVGGAQGHVSGDAGEEEAAVPVFCGVSAGDGEAARARDSILHHDLAAE